MLLLVRLLALLLVLGFWLLRLGLGFLGGRGRGGGRERRKGLLRLMGRR